MEVFVQEGLVELLNNCRGIKDPLRRKLAIASVITKVFSDNGKQEPVIVGGLVVATYSFGQYATEDIDMLTIYDDFPYKVLDALGYEREGKDSFHRELKSYVEFPSGRLSGDEGRVMAYTVEETNLNVYILCVEDIILDRLDSYVSTNDHKSKEWVIKLLAGTYPEIDWSYLHHTAHERGTLKELEVLQRLVKRYSGSYDKIEAKSSVNRGKMDSF